MILLGLPTINSR